jgi:preprotein translocase subunit SecG
MFTFLLVVHAIIAAALVGVILVQRSEGGGLGMGGGSPSGLMSARGAADFLTRATAVLATVFVVMSIVLAGIASVHRAPQAIDTSLARKQPAQAPGQAAPAPAAPAQDANNAVPLAQ